MKFENTEVWGFEHAIRGMRNPLESWEKSDTRWIDDWDVRKETYYSGSFIERDCDSGVVKIIGKNDLELMQKLIKAGSEHRKFMRQIFVSVDITAPLYWWKEFDTYKVGTVANSTSTMHKLASTPITMGCFEMDDFKDVEIESSRGNNIGDMSFWWSASLEILENLRQKYNETKDKRYWKELIRFLPESWLQIRTVTMNYENILSMIHQRKNHKLSEWSESFIDWTKTLPYAETLFYLGFKNETNNE